MGIRFRRSAPAHSPTGQSKQEALAEARKATARLRRTFRRARRYQSGKQDDPIEQMTPNQYLGG
jgi:hypothetical protein